MGFLGGFFWVFWWVFWGGFFNANPAPVYSIVSRYTDPEPLFRNNVHKVIDPDPYLTFEQQVIAVCRKKQSCGSGSLTVLHQCCGSHADTEPGVLMTKN